MGPAAIKANQVSGMAAYPVCGTKSDHRGSITHLMYSKGGAVKKIFGFDFSKRSSCTCSTLAGLLEIVNFFAVLRI